MRIEVRLFAYLRKLSPQGSLNLEIAEGSTVQDLIDLLKLNEEAVLIIMINGRRQDNDTVLNDGDRIGIFPPVGGG